MPGPIDSNLLRRASATKSYLIGGAVVGVATAVLTIFQAWLLSRSIAGLFAKEPEAVAGLPVVVAVVAGIFLAKGVLAWLNQWLGHRASAAVKSQLRTEIMRARLARPVGSQAETGGLITLVTQGLDALDGYFSKYLPQLLLAGTVPVIVVVAVLTSDLLSAVIAAVTVPMIPVFMALVGWTTRARTAKRWALQTRFAGRFADLVMGLPTLQVFGRARAQAKGLIRTEASHRKETMGTLRLSFLSALVLELLSTLSVAVIAVTIGFRVVFGGIDLATALFVLVLAPEVFLPVRQVGTHYHDSADGVAAAQAAAALIDEAEVSLAGEAGVSLVGEAGVSPVGESSGLRTVHASAEGRRSHLGEELFTSSDQITYPLAVGEQVVHSLSPDEVSLAGEAGVSLVGEAGVSPVGESSGLRTVHASAEGRRSHLREELFTSSDQTTYSPATERRIVHPLLELREVSHTYPGMDTPALSPFSLALHKGEVVALAGPSGAGKTTVINAVMGFLKPTTGAVLVDGHPIQNLADWHQQVAYVGQFPGLVAGSVADNVRLGFLKATDTAVRAALDQAGASGIELAHLIAMDAEGVSAGERRRIATARALLRVTLGRARLMVLDEPTAGLDAEAESVLLATLRKLGVTAIVVSHRPQVLASADRVVQLAVWNQRIGETPASGVTLTETVEVAELANIELTVATDPNSRPVVDFDSDLAINPDPATDSDLTTGFDGDADPAPKGQGEPAGFKLAESELAPTDRRRRSLVSRIFDVVPGSRIRLVGAILLAFLATGSSVALMGTSAWLLSFAATIPPVLYLQAPAVLVRLFGISRGVFRYLERLSSHDVALRMQSALRIETYKSLAKTTLFGTRRGDLLTRVVTDVSAIQDLMVRVWIPFVSSALVIVLSCVILGFFSLSSTLVLLVSAVLAGFVVPLLARRASHRADTAAIPIRGELADVVHELARSAADLVAYGQDGVAIGRFQDIDSRLRRGEARSAWVRGVAEGFQTIAAGVSVVAALWLGGYQVLAGVLQPEMLAVLVFAPLALHESFSVLNRAAQTHTQARAALRRVEDITNADPIGVGDLPDQLVAATPELRVRDLVAGWPGSVPVVSGLNLKVSAGEQVALTGPSGIGKTTVAATLLGLIEAKGGSIEVIGRLGYLAQDAHIFNTTVAENVRIGRKDATESDIAAALARAGLAHLDQQRIVGEDGSRLSGGEIRRVSLARLLAGQYQVIILDEPTEHLDALTAQALLDDIWATAAELPILAITHDPNLIARCSREVKLGAGQPSVT